VSNYVQPIEPLVGLIWAQTSEGVIGVDGDMPWHLSEDFAHFKATTMGCPVIMGRATWESLPQKNRPLPGRVNIVLTRSREFSAPGAHIANSVEEALNVARKHAITSNASHIWVIGGGRVYEQFMSEGDLLEVTIVDLNVTGDTFAPQIPTHFGLTQRNPHKGWLTSSTDIPYAFHTYRRKGETA